MAGPTDSLPGYRHIGRILPFLRYVGGFSSDLHHPKPLKSSLFVLYSVPFVLNDVNISICSKYAKSVEKVQCTKWHTGGLILIAKKVLWYREESKFTDALSHGKQKCWLRDKKHTLQKSMNWEVFFHECMHLIFSHLIRLFYFDIDISEEVIFAECVEEFCFCICGSEQ